MSASDEKLGRCTQRNAKHQKVDETKPPQRFLISINQTDIKEHPHN